MKNFQLMVYETKTLVQKEIENKANRPSYISEKQLYMILMVGRDTPKPIRAGRLCKTSQVQATVAELRIPCLSAWGVSTIL